MYTSRILLSALLAGAVGVASANVEIDIDFETDASTAFTVVTFDAGAADDFVVNFDYDYIAAGIPLAPSSTVGDTKGLYIQVNSGDATAQRAGVNAILNLTGPLVGLDDYTLKFDVFANVPVGATTPSEFIYYGSSTGASFLHGAGADLPGATWNGFAFGHSNDGGFTSDYVYYEGEGTGTNGYFPHLPQWWGVPTAAPANALFNNTDTQWADFLDIATTGTTTAGTQRNIWLTVEVEIENGDTAFVYYTPPGKARTLVSNPAGVTIGNGPTTLETPGTPFSNIDASNPFIGYSDINTSISTNTVYVVFDNVQLIVPSTSNVNDWTMY